MEAYPVQLVFERLNSPDPLHRNLMLIILEKHFAGTAISQEEKLDYARLLFKESRKLNYIENCSTVINPLGKFLKRLFPLSDLIS